MTEPLKFSKKEAVAKSGGVMKTAIYRKIKYRRYVVLNARTKKQLYTHIDYITIPLLYTTAKKAKEVRDYLNENGRMKPIPT